MLNNGYSIIVPFLYEVDFRFYGINDNRTFKYSKNAFLLDDLDQIGTRLCLDGSFKEHSHKNVKREVGASINYVDTFLTPSPLFTSLLHI